MNQSLQGYLGSFLYLETWLKYHNPQFFSYFGSALADSKHPEV